MGRPLGPPRSAIAKRRAPATLRELSASLQHAARTLRHAAATPSPRRAALNSAYRHAFRAALALHADYGATAALAGASPASLAPGDPAAPGAAPPPPQPHPQPERDAVARMSTFAARRREGNADLERLLRRSERLPRLPLPPALRAPMADLAARSAQLVQQRRQLDAASADMRELHERLLNDMERTAQHFADAAAYASPAAVADAAAALTARRRAVVPVRVAATSPTEPRVTRLDVSAARIEMDTVAALAAVENAAVQPRTRVDGAAGTREH